MVCRLMRRRWGNCETGKPRVRRGRQAVAFASVFAMVFVLAASAGIGTAAKPKVKPKPGTYVGIGTAKSGGSKYYLRIGFRIKGGNVDVISLEQSYPGCSGGGYSVSGPLVKRNFDLATNNPSGSPSFREIKGRFATNTAITGTMQVVIPPASTCGTPGTYDYTYSAKRYGGP